jgi:hypothetical protein
MCGDEVNQRGTRPGGSADEGAVLPARRPVVQAEHGTALHDESSPPARGDPARRRQKIWRAKALIIGAITGSIARALASGSRRLAVQWASRGLRGHEHQVWIWSEKNGR